MGRPQIVVLGMMTKIPVAGVVWQTLHYLVGLERLGYETYYVEAHARTPSMLMERADDDSSTRAATFIAGALEPFGFRGKWAYHALHADGRCFGLDERDLGRLYSSAALIINLHGGTEPRTEHFATDRLVYLETDPVDVEIQLSQSRRETVDYLRPHCAYFTFGENYGNEDCQLPVSPEFNFLPTRQPVVLDFWRRAYELAGGRFTTVASWRQPWRDIRYAGETYTWSKHVEFMKFLELPTKTTSNFELALASCPDADREVLERNGWLVRDALSLSRDIGAYHDFISASRGEFTVAKDQNVRLRTGWFSDRSATYLAAGRPVITQDTGFGNVLPTGEGLFAFRTVDDILAAVDAIESDYPRHSKGAASIAREFFDAKTVLRSLLDRVGMPRVPPGLTLTVTSRRPTTLERETIETVVSAPLPVSVAAQPDVPDVSAIVVTHDGLAFTRLCLESVLASHGIGNLELLVVDNASTDGTLEYLTLLSSRDTRARVFRNDTNLGFAAAVNLGLSEARGRTLAILNNDTVVPPRALATLFDHLQDSTVGLVGPVSNEAATEAEIELTYATYAGLIRAARDRARTHARRALEVSMLTMFCVAMRRDVLQQVGPLDERFELALFEDDDYSLRVRAAGLRIVVAEDVLVHHFGEGSLGALVPSGEHAELFHANKRRFENKWGVPWVQHSRRATDDYLATVDRILETVAGTTPAGARVLVVSKGDDTLLRFDGRLGAHFPQTPAGVYAGHHPADSSEAIAELEHERSAGAEFLVIPNTSLWWLDHYGGFREYLREYCREMVRQDDTCVIYALGMEP